MKTRTLILLAMACGLAILVAGGAFLWRVIANKDELTIPDPAGVGQTQQVGPVRATLLQYVLQGDQLDVTVRREHRALGTRKRMGAAGGREAGRPVTATDSSVRRQTGHRVPSDRMHAGVRGERRRSLRGVRHRRPATAVAALTAATLTSMPEQYDLVVIGGGPGGYAAALYGASAGLKVACVEKDKVGGTCLHRGCVPAKEFLETAAVYRHVAGAKEFGIEAGQPTIDFAVSQARKQRGGRRSLRARRG